MVCSVGTMKMAVIARILASGSFSQAVTEKAGRQKLVSQYIQKELLEADESNLLDEEDMHVFDLNPLTDPLHLVCCGSCKKPVKTSQFTAHAGFSEELLSELESGTGNRKPRRRAKKKLATAANKKTSAGVQQRFAVVDASETAVSTSYIVEHAGVTTCSDGAKENLQMRSGSDAEVIPLVKRTKLLTHNSARPSDIQEACCVGSIIHCHGASTYVPAPLATKTFYSQRNNRFKSAVSYMYHQAPINECNIDQMVRQGSSVNWEASVPRIFSNEQLSSFSDKMHLCSPSTENADKTINGNSEVSLDKDGFLSLDDSVNQITMTDSYTSQSAAFGAMRTTYHSLPYSFSGNSGTLLPSMKQPDGTVHVV